MTTQWQKIRLGDVLQLDVERIPVDSGTSYPMVGVLSFGRGLFERQPIENGNTSYKFFYRLKAEHVVMSQLFGWEGALALSSKEFAGKFLSPQFPTFLCRSEKLDREFLGWLMQRTAFWDDLGSRASGMGDRRRTLNPEALFACEIPLPPLLEQQRIVMRIQKIAGRMRELQQLRALSTKETETVLETAIGLMIGEGWPVVQLQDAVDPERPITYGIVQAGPDFPGGVPYIRVSDMAKSQLTPNGMLRTHPEIAARYRRSAVRTGDIVFAIRATIGKMRFVPPELNGANLTQGTARIAPNARSIGRYLFWALRSRKVGETIRESTKGSTFKEITLGRLRTIPIPLPPIREQETIVTELDELQRRVDCANHLQAEVSVELDALLPSILDKAFRGEL